MVDAGHQVGDVHPRVEEAPQHGAHLGQGPLIAAHVQRDRGQVHEVHGAVGLVDPAALAFEHVEPQGLELVPARDVDQAVFQDFQVGRHLEPRPCQGLLQARQVGLSCLQGGGHALVDP
ncbi:MAG: hypothetical protein ABSB41_02275 [Anaerolineales bacterium]